jgi:hypothetical protein
VFDFFGFIAEVFITRRLLSLRFPVLFIGDAFFIPCNTQKTYDDDVTGWLTGISMLTNICVERGTIMHICCQSLSRKSILKSHKM